MGYWIFKLAKQELYSDIPGEQYVFDNTHSVRLQSGDTFIYLDKRNGYEFSGTGTVESIQKRKPNQREMKRSKRIHTIFTAQLKDIVWFTSPLIIASTTKMGRSNRAKLGISDVNLMGWSQSMPRISEEMYSAIMNLIEAESLIPIPLSHNDRYEVPDNWSKTRVRKSLAEFKEIVNERHKSTCAICGTKLRAAIDVAHISPYATDKKNRANPANGICLCTFCHRALDRRLIAIKPSGEILVSKSICDPIAIKHFAAVDSKTRKNWLTGIDNRFLELTIRWFNDNLINQ